MAAVKYKGTGAVATTDYKSVKWVGTTKGGKAITITIPNAINLGNIDWTFAEKDDVVAQVVFTGVYDNTDEPSESTEEPFTIELADGVTAGASEIMLGAGIFYIGNTAVGLTRGGGQFTVTREFRNINADGDRGQVKDRIVMDASEPTLTMNLLQILTKVADIYPGLATVS